MRTEDLISFACPLSRATGHIEQSAASIGRWRCWGRRRSPGGAATVRRTVRGTALAVLSSRPGSSRSLLRPTSSLSHTSRLPLPGFPAAASNGVCPSSARLGSSNSPATAASWTNVHPSGVAARGGRAPSREKMWQLAAQQILT